MREDPARGFVPLDLRDDFDVVAFEAEADAFDPGEQADSLEGHGNSTPCLAVQDEQSRPLRDGAPCPCPQVAYGSV
jgi:hypothetical protein